MIQSSLQSSLPSYWHEVYRRIPRYHSTPLPTINNIAGTIYTYTPFTGIRSGVGVNNCTELAEYWALVDMFRRADGTGGFWSNETIAQGIMRRRNQTGNAQDYALVQLGSFIAPVPYPVPPAFTGQNVVQLRLRGDMVWELAVQRGGVAGVVTVGPAGNNNPHHFLLHYKPDTFVRAYVDGLLLFEESGVLPDPAISDVYGFGYACTTNAGGGSSVGDFGNIRIDTVGLQ